jgi:dipeptidyl aminopeptidase/acylaminoacyl peptidase
MKTLLASALLATATLQPATADLFPSFQAGANRVNFISQGERIIGTLFLPPNYAPGQQYPALIVEGPWTQVKEQVGYRYANELVNSGYAVLAFDPRFFGESAGKPRQ